MNPLALSSRIHRIAPVALALLLGPLTALATPASADDTCRFFVNADFRGDQSTYRVPESPPSGVSWAGRDIRRNGEQLRRDKSLYENVEAIPIDARSTDVALHLFEGNDFDGRFLTYRCPQGSNCVRRFPTSWRNRPRSFICQSDDFVSLASGGLYEALTQNHLVPTALIADPLTAQIHDQVEPQASRYLRDVQLKYGRLVWTTRDELCGQIDCARTSWRDVYQDYLRFDYRVDGKVGLTSYRIYVKVWFKPVLQNGRLVIEERAWKYSVGGGTRLVRNKIGEQVHNQIRRVYPGMGARLTSALRGAIVDTLGKDTAAQLLDGNRRLFFSHPCNYYLQSVAHSGQRYTSSQISNICGGTTPHYAAAPGLRLLKD